MVEIKIDDDVAVDHRCLDSVDGPFEEWAEKVLEERIAELRDEEGW